MGRGLGDFPMIVDPATQLFVNPAEGNYYPAEFSPVIDSAVDSLEDRPAMVLVQDPLGIARSPILAPEYDASWQLRVDDPAVFPPSGLGENVFKDRGALERADFVGLSAILLNPTDNDADGFDINPIETVVQTFGVIDSFSIQLVEGAEASDPSDGTGADDRRGHSA